MITLPDTLALLGLALLAVGLWLVGPWLALSVVGALILLAGIAMGRHSRPEKQEGE